MKELAQKLNTMFRRDKETEASKKFWRNVREASDIARSIRKTGKSQARKVSVRCKFFLIVMILILFALSYVY